LLQQLFLWGACVQLRSRPSQFCSKHMRLKFGVYEGYLVEA
jgi:hypothetical protein